jgi:predicted esterase
MLELKNTMAPHSGGKILYTGTPVNEAGSAMILLHGRGGDANSMLDLVNEMDIDDMAYVLPEATGNTWYPYRFIEARQTNEPQLSSGLALVDAIVRALVENGIGKERIYLLGFSQGACLAADYAARNPARFGGIFVLSGGLIGKAVKSADYHGDLRKTPVFLGCSDVDFHIPEQRVHESAEIFERLNARVVKKIYPGMGHTINRDELNLVKEVISKVNFSPVY